MNSTDDLTSNSFNSARLSHAYIASGGLADTIAMAAVCPGIGGAKPCGSCAHCGKASRGIHPDITIVDKLADKREIVVDQIRQLKKDVIVVPNESGKKAYIVNDANTMNKNAQNAFLQILEEPPSHAVFILRTENPAALLRTVRSRCVELNARLDADLPASAAGEIADEFFSAIGSGNTQIVSFMFQLEKLDKEMLAEFLDAARGQAAAKLGATGPGASVIKRTTLSKMERLLVKAGEMLALNVSPGHISGMICANLLEIED
jgi:hypothetical protein